MDQFDADFIKNKLNAIKNQNVQTPSQDILDKKTHNLNQTLKSRIINNSYYSNLGNGSTKIQSIIQNDTDDLQYLLCENCNSNTIFNDGGNITCSQCGLMKQSEISDEMESQYAGRGAEDNSVTSRSGMTNDHFRPDKNFSTRLVGNALSRYIRTFNNVWRNYETKNQDKTDENILRILSNACKKNSLPNSVIIDSQKNYIIFKQRQKKDPNHKSNRGDKLKGLLGACLYYSCKNEHINRSHQEIADMLKIDISDVSGGCRIYSDLMSDMINSTNHTSYKDFIDRFSNLLGIDIEPRNVRIIKQISDNVYDLELLSNTQPVTFTATTIYFSSILYDFKITKKNVSKVCGITTTTIDNHLKVLIKYAEKIIV